MKINQAFQVLICLMVIVLNSCLHSVFQKNITTFPLLEFQGFWSTPKKGTNFFNEIESPERIRAASLLGLDWIRLTPSKWKSAIPKASVGDFLIGNRTNYKGLIRADVDHLRAILDSAHAAKIKVVLTFLDLPGHYWKQHNKNVQDRRLWQNQKYWSEAIQFLVDVAKEFKGHKAVAGYDLLNEPSPEKTGIELKDWLTDSYQDWSSKIANSPQDLNAFYAQAISEIRKVDSQVSIIVEPGFYATPWAIAELRPIDDKHVYYSFHMYEPFQFTFSHKNSKSYAYPGVIPFGELVETQKLQYWDKAKLKEFFNPVRAWQKRFNISNNRIIVGEFGVNRFSSNAPSYFSDLIEIFDEFGWHWAFYSFREDSWHIMDYELGQKNPTWQSTEKKQLPQYQSVKNPFMEAIKASLMHSKN